MTDLKKKRRGGFYWIKENPYISVTKILSVIDKPALRWWYGKEVYMALAKDPSMSQKDALAAPYNKSKTAMKRGTAVHDIVEAWKNIDEVVGGTSIYKEYAKAFKLWLEDHEVEVQECEKTVVSKKHGYAGTLDMLAKVNGKLMLIDVKTGKALYPEVHLQLSAYKEALGSDIGMAALLLKEDGTYTYQIGSNKLEAFLAAKTLYEGLNSKMLEKVGYEGGEDK